MENQELKEKRAKKIEQVKKLWAKVYDRTAMGDDGELTPEAISAQIMAQRIMSEFMIEESDIICKGTGSFKDTITEMDISSFGCYDDRKWQCELARPIYNAFDCKIILYNYGIEDGSSWHIKFIGGDTDVQICTWLYGYIRKWIWFSAGNQAKKIGKPKTKTEIKECLSLIGKKGTMADVDMWWDSIHARMKLSFALSAMDAIVPRIQEMYQKKQNEVKESENIYALVVLKDKEVKDFIKAKYPNLGTAKAVKTPKLHKSMSEHGYKEGLTIPLTRALNN